MSAASFDTSVPVMPMATPILAVFSAGASLMPSPVMATIWPLRCSAPTMRSLCSGSTRANTRTSSTMASSCSSLMLRSSAPVTSREPGSKISSSRAIASAVAGWSPVIMTERICARRALSTAACASAARRIDHSDETEQHEIVLDRVGHFDLDPLLASAGSMPNADAGKLRMATARTRKAFPASASLRRESSARPCSSSGKDFPSCQMWRLLANRTSGAPFTNTRSSPGILAVEVQRGVALALGGEWDFRDARKTLELGFAQPELASGDDQRAFGRIALHASSAPR